MVSAFPYSFSPFPEYSVSTAPQPPKHTAAAMAAMETAARHIHALFRFFIFFSIISAPPTALISSTAPGFHWNPPEIWRRPGSPAVHWPLQSCNTPGLTSRYHLTGRQRPCLFGTDHEAFLEKLHCRTLTDSRIHGIQPLLSRQGHFKLRSVFFLKPVRPASQALHTAAGDLHNGLSKGPQILQLL